jgi:hypothetical protein
MDFQRLGLTTLILVLVWLPDLSPARGYHPVPGGMGNVVSTGERTELTLGQVGLEPERRSALLNDQRRYRAAGATRELAAVNATLAAEALVRAAVLTDFWLDQRDPSTGLFPHTLRGKDRIWTYGDAGADLFPFLAIAAQRLLPGRYSEILDTLEAERRRSPGLPRNIALDGGSAPVVDVEKELLAAVEYAKDGLLPLVEQLGPTPWLGRLREVTDRALEQAIVPTPFGPIVANSTEVNGSALQVLARLYWASHEPGYLMMGNRISAAYLEQAIPLTASLPVHRWDFLEQEPVGPRRFFLGDHGDEIVSGLVEWERVEMATGAPRLKQHRQALHRMLDRLAVKGRSREGLWIEMMDVPSGQVRDDDLTDNWGYLALAYLNQAQIERGWPDGDIAAAERYEEVVTSALRGVATLDNYPWQDGEMDGSADTIESALYLLPYFDVPEATDWVGEQMSVLYGFQQPDGRVLDDNIDGNFVRTTLLYAQALTQGVRAEPWRPDLALGAVRDGDCLTVALRVTAPWEGHLRFDTSRYRANLNLPANYPRLNQWPEWFTVLPERVYSLTNDVNGAVRVGGEELINGWPLRIGPAQDLHLRACLMAPNTEGR